MTENKKGKSKSIDENKMLSTKVQKTRDNRIDYVRLMANFDEDPKEYLYEWEVMIMGNKYDKMTEEQRKRWNEYSKNYAREKFISVNLKLVKERDNDMIEFLKNSGVPATTLVKLAVKTLMDSGVDIESLKVEKIEKIEKVKEEKKRGPKAMKLNERNNVRKIRL